MSTATTDSDLGEFGRINSIRSTEMVARLLSGAIPAKPDPLCRVVSEWLRTMNVTAAMSGELGNLLQARVACLNDLCAWEQNDEPHPAADDRLRFWIEGARHAVLWWNAGGGDAEFVKPVIDTDAAPAYGNECRSLVPCGTVLYSVVWESLVDWIEPQTVPRAVRDAVASCAEAAQKWCEGIPVPPYRKRTWQADRYLRHSTRLAESLAVLRSELESWDDLILEDFADELCRQAQTEGTGPSAFHAARFSAARDSLLTACREMLVGWPFESDRFQRAVQELSHEIPIGLSVDSPLSGAFEPLRLVFDSLATVCEASKGSCAPRASVLAADESVSPTSCTAEGCHAGLLNIAAWVDQSDVAAKSSMRDGLANLIAKTRHETGVGERSEVGRDLLSLLVHIDAKLAEPVAPSRDLCLLRDQLRRLLVECFPYRILDAAALTGRSYDDFEDRVRVRKAVPGGLSGQIIHVHRPGYIFLLANNRTSVIRPAEVDIAD